jgi:hypothetical protein
MGERDRIFPEASAYLDGWLAADAWHRPMVPRRPRRRFRYDWRRLAWREVGTDTYYRRTFGEMVGFKG